MSENKKKHSNKARAAAAEAENEGTVPAEANAEPELTAQQAEWLEEIRKAIEEERKEYLAVAQRVQADFDNFRRRNANLRADAMEDGVVSAVTPMLVVLDNLDRAVSVAGADAQGAFGEGVSMVLKQFLDVLAGLGVEEIVSECGADFDPRLHNAVMQGPATEECLPGQVLETFQKGYQCKGRVLRPAMVRVAAQ